LDGKIIRFIVKRKTEANKLTNEVDFQECGSYTCIKHMERLNTFNLNMQHPSSSWNPFINSLPAVVLSIATAAWANVDGSTLE